MKAKKSLGQNFLKSVPALNKIIEAGEISKKDTILEIGPGKGALTQKLLEKSECVIAVEKDRELFSFLQEKFKKEIAEKKLILINEDILKFNVSSLNSSFLGSLSPRARGALPLGPSACETPQKGKFTTLKNILPPDFEYKIIANIPYNITGAILKKFLTEKNQPERMILMVQNEVAKRIVVQDKKESILSISIKAYADPKIVMKVPARYFSPAPKVDSAIISIKNISRKTFVENKINEKQFWNTIHAGFAHKRKKLSSNLHNLIENEQKKVLGNKRAEELSFENWINLVKSININKK